MVYTITRKISEGNENVCVYKGLLLSFFASIPFFTQGVETLSITSSAHSGHFISIEDGIWNNTALVIGAALSSPIYCICIEKTGRKTGLFVISIIQGISLIPLFLVNTTNTVTFHAITGVSAGGIFTVIPIYIKEISSFKLQGISMLMMMVMTTGGYMVNLVMKLEERMYLTVALVMVQLALMTVMIESPCYLVMKGKLEEAKECLSKLRRASLNSDAVNKELNELKDESETAKSIGIGIKSLYKNKIWWDSIKIVVALYTTMALCGSVLFLDQRKTLIQLKIQEDLNLLCFSSIAGGSLFSFIAVLFFDRKYLLTLGYSIMALSSGVIGVFTQVDLTVTSPHWIAYAALVVLLFGFGMSWGLPSVILVEIFNFEIRTSILATLFVYSRLLKLVHVHTFQYLENFIGVYTLFYIYASINLYGAVYTLFVVPNIRNKSLKQIEKQIKRIPLPA